MKQAQGLPELIVTLGGRRLNVAETSGIVRVRVHQQLGLPTQCLVTWRADTAAIEPSAGDALRIEIGGHREPLFAGEVTVVEHAYGADASREVRVRAYDALHRLRKRQFTRLHADTDLKALAEALVAGTGLGVDGPQLPLGDVYQCGRSDLDLLTEACSRSGRYPLVDGDTLRLVGLVGDGEPMPVEYGSSLHAAEVEISDEPAFRSVQASWWDPIPARADTAETSDLSALAGVRADAAPGAVGGGGPLLRTDDVGDAPADQLAQAELDVRAMGEVSARLVLEGDPALRIGRRVAVTGLRASLEGTYVVTEATHEIDASGYETVVSTRPPEPPPPRPRDQVTLGLVDDVTDPEDRARVRVRLPAYPDLVTPWVPVLVAAAGKGKGVVALPDAGDTVLVLLPARDPARAIVLGGLYGEGSPPYGEGASRGTDIVLHTQDGQQVRLDAAAHTVHLEDGHGSLVELGPDLLRITSATDLVIEAPGHAMTVRARTVDFEEAT